MNNLPEISFVEEDPARVIQNILATFEGIMGSSLAPADPERLFLEGLGYIISGQRALINHAAKQNLLYFAKEEVLDHMGAFSETERLKTSPAGCICRFFLNEPLEFVVGIAQGKRVSPDGTLFFQTDEYVEISAGGIFVDVAVTCLLHGSMGNGYVPGQINQLVDPVPYIVKVENLTVSANGADVEDDEPYRERIHQAPEKYSVAGPGGAYSYWAKTAHQNISDVSVMSPSGGVVHIAVLMKDGALPDETVLNAVQAAVTAKTRRPMTDLVHVIQPEQIGFSVDLDWYAAQTNPDIGDQVEQALAEFVKIQTEKLGRDINPDDLIYLMKAAGAKRVVLRAPLYRALTEIQVARIETTSLAFKGVEDE